MATINDLGLDSVTKNSYYDPSQNRDVRLISDMTYPCHIKSVKSNEVSVKGKYRAKVFNPTLEIDKECSNMSFQDDNGNEVSGSSFVGRTLYGKGIFLFLEPEAGDKFESNPGGNAGYFAFCESIGIECPTIEIDVDGEKKEVKQLPTLSDNDLIGKPLLGTVFTTTYKDKDGNQKSSLKVMKFQKWEDGSAKDFDDIPF